MMDKLGLACRPAWGTSGDVRDVSRGREVSGAQLAALMMDGPRSGKYRDERSRDYQTVIAMDGRV